MTSAHTQAPAQHSWAPLLTIASGVFLVALDGTITAVANPVLAVELKATLGGLQWVTSAYLLALAGVLVLAGRLGDRWGRKTTFQIGVAGFALSSVGIAASPTIEAVIAARVGQGVFGALIVTNALSLLRTSYSGARLATALATFGTVIGAASATGPLIGGLLVDGVGWRWAFLINAPVGALSLIAAHRYVSGPLPERGKRLDVLGAVVLMSALICLTYGIIHAGETTWASATVVTTLVAGVLLTLTFALVERGQAGALVPLRLFRDRNVVIGVVLGFVSFFSLVGALFFVLLFLQQVQGYSPFEAGLQMLPLSLANVAGSSLAGYVTNRYGHRMTLVLGFVVVTVGFVLMLALDQQTGLLGLVAPFAAIGLGTGMVMTASIQVVLASVEDADAGTASGLQQTATQVGGIAGTAVLGSVMAAYVSRTFARELERAGAGSYSVEDQAAKLVGQGLSPLSGKNGSLAAAVQAATEATFVSGLHLVMVVGAVVTFAGMMLGLFIRPVVVQADHDHGIISHG